MESVLSYESETWTLYFYMEPELPYKSETWHCTSICSFVLPYASETWTLNRRLIDMMQGCSATMLWMALHFKVHAMSEKNFFLIQKVLFALITIMHMKKPNFLYDLFFWVVWLMVFLHSGGDRGYWL